MIEAGTGTNLLSPASLGQIRDATRAVAATPGVQSVTSLIAPTGDGSVPDGFVPSRQLQAMADGFASSGGEAKDLLDPKVTSGLSDRRRTTSSALADPFPEIASSGEYSTVASDLREAPGLIVELHDSALVSNQLRAMAGALGASTALGGGPALGA